MKNILTRLLPALSLTFMCAASGVATAAPISYTIAFTLNPASAGPLPSAGSFSYDASAAPGAAFSNFTVNWDGILFDLTNVMNSANGLEENFGPCPVPGVMVVLLGGCGGTRGWISLANESGSMFLIGDSNGASFHTSGPAVSDATGGTGNYSLITPEPSSAVLLLLGGAWMAFQFRRRRSLAS
jgi:hypothetical protein